MSALVAGGLVEVAVQLGIGRQADAGIWDQTAWDHCVWGASDTLLGDWVDVTCYVIDDTVALGAGSNQADGIVTRWEAATLGLELIGAQWDPWNGPYAGILGPETPIRMQWRPAGDPGPMRPVFTGGIDDEGYTWQPAHETEPWRSRAAVAATDDTRLLATFDGYEQSPVGQGETAAARIGRIADTALWPADRRAITPGGVAVKSTTLAGAAWTMMLAIADTDLALLWVRRDGYLTYLPAGRITPPADLDYVLTPCPDEDPAAVQIAGIIGNQPRVVRNTVAISRQANDDTDTPATVTMRDDGSISRYRVHSYSRTDLQHTADTWSDTIARNILAGGAWPSAAPGAVSLSSRLDPAAAGLLLAVEPNNGLAVDDHGRRWQCAPIGWDVTISRRQIAGVLNLLDVSGWVAGRWDIDAWDLGTWGV